MWKSQNRLKLKSWKHKKKKKKKKIAAFKNQKCDNHKIWSKKSKVKTQNIKYWLQSLEYFLGGKMARINWIVALLILNYFVIVNQQQYATLNASVDCRIFYFFWI